MFSAIQPMYQKKHFFLTSKTMAYTILQNETKQNETR